MDEGELERRAVEELLKEANRAKARAETMGPAGWMKCPLGSTNKRFLLNTLRSSTLERTSERERDEHRYKRSSDGKYRDKDYEKITHKKHSSHRRSHSSKRHSSSRNRSSSPNHHHSKSNSRRSRSPVRNRSPSAKKQMDRQEK
ncbi:hypothetical protein DNTS_012282 [Danionella cerebrum]|uniref:Uncharacterized protein n=1 Tax=Danionella cerebrum TaxID=2873325 RepID=A0A553PEF4_9TELE|nr:hypothetical protein DNTS_012282 [Danionella translucida]